MRIPNPWNAIKAASRVVSAARKSAPVTVSQETVDLRTKICQGCEFFDAQSRQCRVCTCFIPLKTQLATEKCPKGKWPFTNQS